MTEKKTELWAGVIAALSPSALMATDALKALNDSGIDKRIQLALVVVPGALAGLYMVCRTTKKWAEFKYGMSTITKP